MGFRLGAGVGVGLGLGVKGLGVRARGRGGVRARPCACLLASGALRTHGPEGEPLCARVPPLEYRHRAGQRLVERKELEVLAYLAPPRLARVEGELLQMRVPPVKDLHQRGLGVEHLHRRGAADGQELVMLRLEIHLVRVRATG